MNARYLALCAFTLSSTLATAACGGASSEPPGKDAGPAAPVTQNGIVVDYETQKPVAGANVTAANRTATTDANGAYSFTIDSGEPYRVAVTAPGYGKLLFQERAITADYNEGVMNLVSKDEANMLTAAFDGYDANLGDLSVEVIATGKCASEEGATVGVLDASGKSVGKVIYFDNRYPSPGQRAVASGQLPSAGIYNVPPGVPLTLSASRTRPARSCRTPRCTPASSTPAVAWTSRRASRRRTSASFSSRPLSLVASWRSRRRWSCRESPYR